MRITVAISMITGIPLKKLRQLMRKYKFDLSNTLNLDKWGYKCQRISFHWKEDEWKLSAFEMWIQNAWKNNKQRCIWESWWKEDTSAHYKKKEKKLKNHWLRRKYLLINVKVEGKRSRYWYGICSYVEQILFQYAENTIC